MISGRGIGIQIAESSATLLCIVCRTIKQSVVDLMLFVNIAKGLCHFDCFVAGFGLALCVSFECKKVTAVMTKKNQGRKLPTY